MVELGGTISNPSTFTKVVKNQLLNYAFQLHHAPGKCDFWLVDGYCGRAKWHGSAILMLADGGSKPCFSTVLFIYAVMSFIAQRWDFLCPPQLQKIPWLNAIPRKPSLVAASSSPRATAVLVRLTPSFAHKVHQSKCQILS